MNPIPIEYNEWWYQGCFIHKNELTTYYVFEDTEKKQIVGTCCTIAEAKKLAEKNKMEKYLYGYNAFR